MVRAGTYGAGSARRQLWWCRPTDGTPKHRFAERLPRTLLASADDHACAHCETHLAVFEGPQHARQYEHAARTIANALASIGVGGSYRHAAFVARRVAGGAKTWDVKKRTHPGRAGGNGTLAADWVAAFAPVVTAPVFDAEVWPEVVALDELPFKTTYAVPGTRHKHLTNWVIWGAYAHYRSGPGRLFRLGCSGQLNSVKAAEWLLTVPGRPKYVVCDGAKMWPKAIALAWPQVVDEETGEILEESPVIVPCRWHLQQQMREQLKTASILPPRDAPAPRPVTPAPRLRLAKNKNLRVQAESPQERRHRTLLRQGDDPETHPITIATHKALKSVKDWDACLAELDRWQVNTMAAWMRRNSHIREELATRPSWLPNSIGGLEKQLAQVRAIVGPRSKVLKNQPRTQRMLDLVTLHQRGLDSVDEYATHIRRHLDQNAGTAPDQRQGVTGTVPMY
ncbi:hypothetical protein ASD10_08765 [Aeromicrobium sp. Root472D3]|nr:hypothetical protein ASD10_08765 [Aeromicrobium sp. Root472D3]